MTDERKVRRFSFRYKINGRWKNYHDVTPKEAMQMFARHLQDDFIIEGYSEPITTQDDYTKLIIDAIKAKKKAEQKNREKNEAFDRRTDPSGQV